jgi:membrane protein DedA with SNARE-associated domain
MPVPGETALIAFGVLPRRGWPCFLFWNAIGGIVWASGVGLLAHFGGKAFADSITGYGLYAGVASQS